MSSATARPPAASPLTRRSFLASATGAALVGRAAHARGTQPSAAEAPLFMYVGTYSAPTEGAPRTSAPARTGRGIHIFRVDRDTGELTAAGVFEDDTSPSALVVNAAGTRMYAAQATARVDGDTSGTVTALHVDHRTGALSPLNTVSAGGLGPTYVSLTPSGRHLLVANYEGGSVAVCPVLPDGRLGAASHVVRTTGATGPARATNAPPGSFAISGHDAPHPHMIQTDAAGAFVLAPDLGLDRIFVWRLDERSGRLTPAAQPSVALPPGDGPRHFAWHPNGRWLFAIQEEASTVVLFDYDARTGGLAARQTVSSLPAGFAGSSFASGILVSRDGRYVYAGNRLHDSIALFAVGDDGRLTWVGDEWTRGSYPRSFAFSPDGRFVWVCNQRADLVTTFRVDPSTGRLTFTGQYTPVGNPSAIAFVDRARPPAG